MRVLFALIGAFVFYRVIDEPGATMNFFFSFSRSALLGFGWLGRNLVLEHFYTGLISYTPILVC